MIELEEIAMECGAHRALDGLDLRVPAGTVLGLLGPNGAGKSTTIGIVAGLLRPTAGRVSVGGAFGAVEDGPLAMRVGRSTNPLLAEGDRIENPELALSGGLDPVGSLAVALTRAIETLAGRGSEAAAGLRSAVQDATSERVRLLLEHTFRLEPVGAAEFEELVDATPKAYRAEGRGPDRELLSLAGWALALALAAALARRPRRA